MRHLAIPRSQFFVVDRDVACDGEVDAFGVGIRDRFGGAMRIGEHFGGRAG